MVYIYIYDKINQRWRILSPTHGHAFSKPKCGPCDAKVDSQALFTKLVVGSSWTVQVHWKRSCRIDICILFFIILNPKQFTFHFLIFSSSPSTQVRAEPGRGRRTVRWNHPQFGDVSYFTGKCSNSKSPVSNRYAKSCHFEK